MSDVGESTPLRGHGQKVALATGEPGVLVGDCRPLRGHYQSLPARMPSERHRSEKVRLSAGIVRPGKPPAMSGITRSEKAGLSAGIVSCRPPRG